MDVITLSGGLGNQMFQYALYYVKNPKTKSYLSLYFLNREQSHNGYELDSVFNIFIQKKWLVDLFVRIIRKLLIFSKNIIVRLFFRFLDSLGIHLIQEPKNGVFQSIALQNKNGINFYLGCWYSEKYFIKQENDIRKLFTFDLQKLNRKSKFILNTIKKENSISLHIRRGDFLTNGNYNILGNVCTVDYYKRAAEYIVKQVKCPFFFVFSDDINWVKSNIMFSHPTYYIDWNTGLNSWQDMFLMSACKHNIIANSTFSWWGAWLNAYNDKIVVRPSSMLKDIFCPDAFPETWLSID